MSEFRVGQRVRVKEHLTAYKGLTGEVTVVRAFMGGEPNIDVQLDGYEIPHTFIADELAPADPPAPAKDGLEQARIAEIRERLAKVPDEELFVKGNYTYWLVRGMHTGQVVADVPFVLESGQAKQVAEFIAAAPADLRYLLDALDTMRRERDAALALYRDDAGESDSG